ETPISQAPSPAPPSPHTQEHGTCHLHEVWRFTAEEAGALRAAPKRRRPGSRRAGSVSAAARGWLSSATIRGTQTKHSEVPLHASQ
ncbi:unnamed protein product, partial [Rangifer tarandus platyrhynchus]